MTNSPISTLAKRVRRAVIWRARSIGAAVADTGKDAAALARVALRRSLRRDRGERARAERQRVLLIDDLLPDARFGAGYPRAATIVRSLVAAGHHVTCYPMQSTRVDLARMERAFAGAPQFLAGAGARGLRRLLWERGDAFDLLFISRPTPMQAFADARWQPARRGLAPAVVYDAEAVLAPREARRRALFGPAWSGPEQAAALVAELAPARHAHVVTAVSACDAAAIASALSEPVIILSHATGVQPGAPTFAERRDLLFVGRLTGAAAQSPNVDSVRWFLREVMPVLDGLMGSDYKLHVAGLVDSPDLAACLSERVVLHGVVDDLAALYGRCRLFVAPTRFAAGIPLKVMEAMGRGIPCVATPLLAAQLEASGDELPSGESPLAFATECMRLYTDPVAWRTVRDAGVEFVTRCFSEHAFDRALAEVLARAFGARSIAGGGR